MIRGSEGQYRGIPDAARKEELTVIQVRGFFGRMTTVISQGVQTPIQRRSVKKVQRSTRPYKRAQERLASNG